MVRLTNTLGHLRRNIGSTLLSALVCLACRQRLAAQTASSWSAIGTPTIASRVSAVVPDSRNSSTILIATPGGGLWKTEDDGINWAALAESASTLRFCSLTRDPSNPDILYAGSGDSALPAADQGVLRSADGGYTWTTSLPFSDSPVCALAVDPTDGRRIAAASEQGLFLSADSGATWKRLLTGAFTAVAFDPQGKLYGGRLGLVGSVATELGARAGILTVSSNGGASFTNVVLPETPLSAGSRTTAVALLTRATDVYLAVSYQPSDGSQSTIDVYRSLDLGGTWSVAAAVGAASPPMQFASDAAGTRLLLAGSDALLSSTSRGLAWGRLSTLKSRHHVTTITGTSIWIGGEFGLERVPLDGSTLPTVPGPPTAQFADVTGTSINDIFGAGPTGLHRHDGTNQLWSTLLQAEGMSGVVAGSLGANQQRTVIASSATNVYRSTTNGTALSIVTAIPESEARAPAPPLLADPGSLANIFIAGQQLYRSTDQGASFQNFATIDPDRSHVVIALAAAPSARRFMYAATACIPKLAGPSGCPAVSYIWRSTNTGQSWVQAAPVTGWVYQLAVDPRQTATVYAAVGAQPFATNAGGTEPEDIVRSTDNAASWISLRANLPRGTLRSIGIDTTVVPAGNLPYQNLFAGGDKGAFMSFNGGTQWIALNAGLPRAPVAILRQAGSDGILAGTLGRGAYNARISGLTASLIASPLELSATLAPGGTANLSVALSNVLTSTVNWSVGTIALSPGNWLTLGSGGGVVEPRAAVALNLRLDASTLTAGTYTALIQLTSGPTGGTTVSQVIPLALRVETTSFTLTAVSPTAQNGALGTALPPLTVALRDENGNPVADEAINFSLNGGGTLSRRTALTLADGTASVILTLPTAPGTTTVTATYRDQSVQFTAQALQVTRPSLQAGSAVSAATFLSGTALAPGQIISIFGQNLASGQQSASALPLPTTLLTTRALLVVASGDIALPLFYVSPLQVNAMLPMNIAPGTYGLTVEVGGVRGNEIQITVANFAPGIFTLDSSGRGAGIFLKADGSLVSATNPATRGSVVSFYAVGLGAVNPELNAGEPGRTAAPLNRTTTTPRVFFDNLEGVVSFSGIAPGFAGLYQINVQVPAGLAPASNIPVSMTIGGAASNRVTIPVQ